MIVYQILYCILNNIVKNREQNIYFCKIFIKRTVKQLKEIFVLSKTKNFRLNLE